MKNIPFTKYTSYGNNFVIVDEIEAQRLSEAEKSRFGFLATNTCFGVGSDNLLVIQRCNAETLAGINLHRGYWHAPPDPAAADYLFRMFEPDGTEALCCGNGLMCIADHLARRHGVRDATIMTELPLPVTRVSQLGATGAGASWVDLGTPRHMPPGLVDAGAAQAGERGLDVLQAVTIGFRSHDLAPYSDQREVTLEGYLVFTGEPHLVLFPDKGLSLPQLLDTMFLDPTGESAANADKRAQFGSWLVHRTGCYLNTKCGDVFPSGINVNFARVHAATNQVEYRCFERGINRETLACGTGALAVAYVASQLGKLEPPAIDVLPHRCRWFLPQARLQVRRERDGWMLSGDPQLLFEGSYELHAEGVFGAETLQGVVENDFDRPAMPSGNYIAIMDDAVAEASSNR